LQHFLTGCALSLLRAGPVRELPRASIESKIEAIDGPDAETQELSVIAIATAPHIPRRASANATGKKAGFFFGPLIDFLLLGGISFLLLPVALLVPDSLTRPVAFAMVAMSLLIHGSHFANSYQLFYRSFRAKAFQRADGSWLPYRYIWAGIIVPLALIMLLGLSIALGDMVTLGRMFNVLIFFVGWHYIKQGYGILIVDAAFKSVNFKLREKQILLFNAYAIWLLTWISANLTTNTGDLYGIAYQTFEVPATVQSCAIGVAAVSSLASTVVLLQRGLTEKVPINGLVAYFTSLYLWLLFVRIDPIWQIVVPGLHSLQYLVVVWRYELNRHNLLNSPLVVSDSRPGNQRSKRFYKFVLNGVLLGFLGFWLTPLLLHVIFPLRSVPPNSAAFFFAGWVFINVHHYFLDNVIWRSENPDLRKFLFAKVT
jgi:hypothetical protein